MDSEDLFMPCNAMAHFNKLRYGTVELQETGRGAECGLQKSQNGSGVFHYIG